MQQLNIEGSAAYPDALRVLEHAPKTLYIRGDSSVLTAKPLVSIVGSRKPTTYGKHLAYKLAYDLANAGFTVVSGLALGIDAEAHRAALDAGGKTIAVQANGLDTLYPATNARLGEEIIDSGGAVISEFKPGTPALKQNFLQRNRIVSGLSNGLIVIEAAERSGTSSTANHALEQGKTVMALPGNVTSPLSKGTNNLIKQGAALITNAEDVAHELGFSLKEQGSYAPKNQEEKTILELAAKSTPINNVEPSLLTTISELEIQGVISIENATLFLR